MQDLLSVDSAAKFLGLSPWTIRAWLSGGRLTRLKVGSRTFVRQSELEQQVQVETREQAAVRNSNRDRDAR